MRVRIPSPLRSYTAQKSEVEVPGKTVREVLFELDRRHSGIRFRMIDEQDRIRQHIKIFVNAELITDLSRPLTEHDIVKIVCALSGG